MTAALDSERSANEMKKLSVLPQAGAPGYFFAALFVRRPDNWLISLCFWPKTRRENSAREPTLAFQDQTLCLLRELYSGGEGKRREYLETVCEIERHQWDRIIKWARTYDLPLEHERIPGTNYRRWYLDFTDAKNVNYWDATVLDLVALGLIPERQLPLIMLALTLQDLPFRGRRVLPGHPPFVQSYADLYRLAKKYGIYDPEDED